MTHTLTEGGQITSHRLRMLRQVFKTAIFGSLFIGLLVFIGLMLSTPLMAYLAMWYFAKAWILQGVVSDMEINRDFLNQVINQQLHYNPHLRLEYVNQLMTPIVQKLILDAYGNTIIALQFTGCTFGCILGYFIYRGRLAKEKMHLTGAKIVSPTRLNWRLRINGKQSPIKIGSIPLIKNSETQHLLISGGTGSGKTNCLHHILGQVRKLNQKVIIVDTTEVFVDRYYRPGIDVLLNPLDPRSVEWNPWAEGCSNFDYAELAEAFMPSSNTDSENYWRVASRSVFISLLKKFSDTKKTSDIIRWIQYEPLSNLCKLLVGTKAAAHMDLSSEKTASSIRSVASTFLDCLETIKDTENPFSIRNWLNKEDGSWLFLQCTPSQRALLRPLMTAWISSAVRGLLSLPVDLKRRIWFSMDELPTLQRVKDLEMLLTEGRKYGGCGIITLQSPAQLESIYGRDVTKTIIGNTATKIIFREADPEIAERISRAFGEREVMEIQEGISYGAHETRDGVTLSMQNKNRPVVSATQIMELPVNTAYVKLAEEQIVTKIKLPIVRH